MMKFILSLSILILCAAFPVQAQDQSALSQSEVEAIVKDYILNNGDVLIDGIESYQRRKEVEDQQAAVNAIKRESDYLYNNPNSPEAGNPEASVTLVEFFDYNCGYCKKALSDVQELLNEDDDLRVVFKEVPILSPASREAAKWSLASKKQGKYLEYHIKLMQHRGQYDESTLAQYAGDVGMDVDQLKEDKDSAEIEAQITKNLGYMEMFGIRGTPSFIVGDELARGYVGKERLKLLISGVREKNQ